MINKVILSGIIGKDAEVRTLDSGKCVITFSLATTEKYNGNETTQWHNIVYWPKTDAIAQYLTKGKAVEIDGKLTYRTWDDKDGNRQYRTEVVANRVEFCPMGKRDEVVKSGDSSLVSEQPDILAEYEDELPF